MFSWWWQVSPNVANAAVSRIPDLADGSGWMGDILGFMVTLFINTCLNYRIACIYYICEHIWSSRDIIWSWYWPLVDGRLCWWIRLPGLFGLMKGLLFWDSQTVCRFPALAKRYKYYTKGWHNLIHSHVASRCIVPFACNHTPLKASVTVDPPLTEFSREPANQPMDADGGFASW